MKLLAELGPMEATVSLDFSPDGHRLISSGFNGDLKLWDVINAKLTVAVTAHRGTTVGCARFSPDGRWLAPAGGDQVICVGDAQRLELKRILKGHADQVWALDWMPDSKSILSTSRRHGVRYWPLETPDTLDNPPLFSAYPLHFSADSKWIAMNLIGESGVVLWNVKTGKVHAQYTNDFVLAGFDVRDGSLLGTDPQRALLHRLSVPDLQPVGKAGIALEDPAGKPKGGSRMGLFPNSKHLLVNQLGQDLRIYETSTGHLIRKIPIPQSSDTGVASLDDSRFIVATSDSILEVHHLETGQILKRLKGHGAGPINIAVSPDGKQFASADWDGRLRVWDAHSYDLLIDLTQFDGAGPMAFSTDGRTLIKAELTHIHFVHLFTRRADATLPFQVSPNDTLTISPDNSMLALIDRSGQLRLWQTHPK